MQQLYFCMISDSLFTADIQIVLSHVQDISSVDVWHDRDVQMFVVIKSYTSLFLKCSAV